MRVVESYRIWSCQIGEELHMQVLAINGSPRGAKGNTERVLQPFLEGAREAGAETEVIYLKDHEIKHYTV